MAIPLFLSVLLLSFIPMMGSRSLGNGVSVVSFDTSDEGGGALSQEGISANGSGEDENEKNASNATLVSTPCALVTMSLLEGRDGKLMSEDEKTRISVSHDIYDVSQGIVPTIVYEVALEIPSGHEFSLEFWLNGFTEEKVKQKRRHQRDRRDTFLELYPQNSDSSEASYPRNTGSANNNGETTISEPFVFCSKSSLAGVNRDATTKVLKFHWYINGNNYIPLTSVSGIPSNVIFRSIVEATTSVFEENLSVIVRPDCYLQLKVEATKRLTLRTLWNERTDNGLNCTIFIVPKHNFGLEISLSSLSVHGMRDICKGRYLQFTRRNPVSQSSSFSGQTSGLTSGRVLGSSTVSTGSSISGSGSTGTTSNLKYLTNNNNNFLEKFQEFPSPLEFHNDNNNAERQYSPLEHKFCGKLEDYTEAERILTFPSSESTTLSASPFSSDHGQPGGTDNEIRNDRASLHETQNQKPWGIYLTVRLPVAVKAREAFAFEVAALSPCQRVVLNSLDGQLKYSKHYENDQCSVVIHVPYGNTILTQIAVSRKSEISHVTSNNNSNRRIIAKGNSIEITRDNGEQRHSRGESDIITGVSNDNGTSAARVGRKDASQKWLEPVDNISFSDIDAGDRVGTSNTISVANGGNNIGNWSENHNEGVNNVTSDRIIPGTDEDNRVNNVGTSDVLLEHHHKKEARLFDASEGEEALDNSIPLTASGSSITAGYECPMSLEEEEESNDINRGNSIEEKLQDKIPSSDSGDSNKESSTLRKFQKQHKHLLIQAVDLVSGSEFNWCFDASKQNSAHKRAWKSSGNRVSINFTLSYFDTFVLTYQSVKIPELAGDCERGWVKVDGACVTLVEKATKWTDAEESCQLLGGHLVTVKNELNENKIENLVTESPLFHPSRAYWIGANDRESEGNFQWTSGLAFQYKNWFPGWTQPGRNDRSEILSAQPNDDGWSGQDCVEIRQIEIPPSVPSSFSSLSASSTSDKTVLLLKPDGKSSNSRAAERGHPSQFLRQGFYSQDRKFYWNDVDVSCNRTLKLSSPQVSSAIVTSPAYPSAYPDNIMCVTVIETTPGFKLILSFDEFILEESPGCQYDSLEIVEIQPDPKAGSLVHPTQTNGVKQQQQQKSSRANTRVNNNRSKGGKKICGDWTKKLKLLRYTTASKSTQVILKFESDFSHHFPGFKVKVTAEKDMEEQCVEQQMQRYGNHCYLLATFPAVTWTTAHQICETLKGNLASIVSTGEWGFLTRTLLSSPDYDKKSIYWLGGSIDQNNQLGWVDHMPFNFSGFHPADLQTRYDFRCLSVYWHDSGGGSKGDLAWRLTECSQTAGYICKKKAQVEMRQFMNKTFTGTGGKLASPNYPSNYVSNIDHRNHLIAPRGTKIVIRFSYLDIEPQENCLYDYVEILDRATRNRTRFCGTYHKEELTRLDYVSSSNEVDVIFHTDFSNSFTGYELLWRAVDVTGCTSGKTIMAGFVGSPFPLGDQTIHTPNFPYFNLPHLDCIYHIVAPAGQRLWLNFQVFELGRGTPTSGKLGQNNNFGEESVGDGVPWTGINCRQQDHVSIDLTGGQFISTTFGTSSTSDGKLLTDLANDNEILICGNLSSIPYRTSFISSSERVAIRVHSPEGHSGRGFLGRFKAIPHVLREGMTVNTEPNSTMSLTSLNFPLEPPSLANLSVSFIAPPQYVIIMKIKGSTKCPPNVKAFLEIRDPYVGKNGVTKIICHLRESVFPSYTVDEDDHDGVVDRSNGHNYGSNVNMGSGGSGSNRLMKNDDIFELVDSNNNGDDRMGADNGISLGTTIHFRSRFNRLEVKQVYLAGYHGSKWNAQITTTLDENFRAEIIADGDRLLLLNACSPNLCQHGGTCVTEKGRHICRCVPPYTGPYCALSLCDLNPCLFGDCIMEGKSFKCKCQLGYGGERCERRYKPCDDRPCSGHGDCIEVNKTSYRCLCLAWWEGPQCESRMLNIPYKPLSQRMLEEPFWLGLITVFVVMGVIGLIWCLKRHFPEKLEKFLSEDLERNRGISWAPSSVRTGGVVGPGPLGVRDAIPGTSQQAASPPTTRSFLGRLGNFGIRKPSLLSLSSATSNVSATVASPHTYENRTFSLDDLLRPSRGMLRTPSPHRRRNYSVQVRRDPNEKQQILQQLISPGPSLSFDGESKPATPKPTLAEIIQMSEKRLRLASQSSMQEPQPSTSAAAQSGMCSINTSIDSVTSQRQDSAETSFTTIAHPSSSSMAQTAASAAATKAEKKVTFAHMLDKLAAGEMSSSSSCSDVSCGEDTKMIVTVPVKPAGKKDRKGRFRRSKPYRNRTSEEDGAEISSSDTTPDPIFPPRFPLRICVSPTNTTGPSASTTAASSTTATVSNSASGGVASPVVPTSLSAKSHSSGKLTKIASADSLLSLFRRFSGSSSAPPSPQYSENEESSAVSTPTRGNKRSRLTRFLSLHSNYEDPSKRNHGATPLSTPSSPRNSALSLRPPAFLITTPAEPPSSSNSSSSNSNTIIELPVIDPFTLGPAPGQGWNRTSGAPTITLEVPLRDYCLSPIHEVPTPLPTPSHSPAHTPMMRRPPQDGIPMIKVQSSEDDDSSVVRRPDPPLEQSSAPRKLSIPIISISLDGGDNNNDDVDDGVEIDDDDCYDDEPLDNQMEGGKGWKNFPGEPEVIPDVLINVPPDASLESKPDHGDNVVASASMSIDSGPGPPPLSPTSFSSQGKSKPRPPPLIFANEILSSATPKVSKEDSIGSGSTSSSNTSSTGSCCSSSCTSITSSVSTCSSGSSSSTTSSCGSGGCSEGGAAASVGTNNIINNNSKGIAAPVPLLSVEVATPVSEALPKFVTSPEEVSSIPDKIPPAEVVSCLVIPHIWECPLAPPMITINQSSEAESDSDTTVTKSVRRPNLNFLSPFSGDANRIPSESNLSTSGYSSMASPCASRCPSVSPLCPSEMEDYHNCHQHSSQGHSNQVLIRRASLTPSTPKKPSPTPRRSSLNSGTPLISYNSSGFLEKRSLSEERYEEDKKKLAEVEVETDSAVEVETDMECQGNNTTLELTASSNTLNPPEEPEDRSNGSGTGGNSGAPVSSQLLVPNIPASSSHPPLPIYAEELKCINNLLQVPKKGFPKSRSLDINSTTINDMPYSIGLGSSSNKGGIATNTFLSGSGYTRNQQLKVLGPSLDSKLNSIEPTWSNGQKVNNGSSSSEITISLPMTTPAAISNKTLGAVHSAGNLIPEDGKDRRLSPVSSRSESPLSELSGAGGSSRFTACPGSPVTDSDGIYDCPSSEVQSNHNELGVKVPRLTSLNKLSPQQQLRRSGRRKDRRLARNRQTTTAPTASSLNNNNPNSSNNNFVSESTSAAADLLPPPLIPSPVVYHSSVASTPSSVDLTSKLPPSIVGPPGVSSASPAAATTSLPVAVAGEPKEGRNSSHIIFPHIDLPPSLARESLVPVGAISKRASPKRRVRAQPALDVSSSSSESLSSRSRSRTSVSSFQQSSSSPKRSLEEVDVTYALSDSAIGKCNSISGVVSSSPGKGATIRATALLQHDKSVPSTSRKGREISPPKPDVIQQQPTTSAMAGIGNPRGLEQSSGSPAKRKISRLRTISHQIRFLRRLELSLIRKKECLTSVNRPQEILLASSYRDSFLRSDSWDTSREDDLSDDTESTSDNNDGKGQGELHETEKPLLPRSSSSPGTLCFKLPTGRVKPKSSSTSGSTRMIHMDLLDNCSAAELLSSHKKKLRKYK